jgi:cytidylate kinase
MIITIDGPAGAGKSTVARIVARRLGLPYLNSGFIYRAVTLLVLERAAAEGCAIEEMFERRDDILKMIGGLQLTFRDEAPAGEGDSGRTLVFIGAREISGSLKSPEVTSNIWRVADDGEYRGGLLGLQRSCVREAGVVAEGRDMGSVVFRDADLKFYLDASSEERARILEELTEASVFTKVESEGGKLGFRSVTVDPDGYRSGNLNRALVEGGADSGFTDVVTLEPSRRREGDGVFS